MRHGFDIEPVHKTRKKTKSQAKLNRKSNSVLSWVILILITIAATSFLTSTSNQQKSNTPKSSIEFEVLADKETQKAAEKETKANIINDASKDTGIDLENANNQSDYSEINNNQDNDQNQENPTASPNPATTTLDMMELKIKILNGSNQAKIAAKAKDFLEKKGYVIAKIGNAKNTYNKTYIYYHKGKINQAKQISQSFNIQTKIEENNQLTQNYDLVIVVGKDYANSN